MSKKPASEYLTATKQFFGDGEYWMMLRMVQMSAIEKRFDYPISRVYGQLLDGLYEDTGGNLKFYGGADIRPGILNEIMRQALLGGNSGPDMGEGEEVGPQRADILVDAYGYPERPIEEVAQKVFRVLHAAIVGDPAQREAMPEIAKATDERRDRLNRQVGEMFGPAARAREESAGALSE